MRVIGIVGWSGSGKTSLVIRLVPELVRRGVKVSTIKHAHHEFDVDTPGKDSWRHRQAGAHEVMVSSPKRWALMHEHRSEPEANLQALLARMTPVDLVLVEGFKNYPHEKICVWRESVGKPLLAYDDPDVVAVAGAPQPANLKVPFLPLDDTNAVADFIMRHCNLGSQPQG